MSPMRLVAYFSFILFLCLPLAVSVNATEVRSVVGAKKVWAGLYEGKQDLFSEPRLVKETDHIPGRVHSQFGVFFKVLTEPADADGFVLLHLEVHIPEPGVWDSRSQTYVRVATDHSDCVVKKPCLLGYGIDSKNEIVPGEWTIDVFFGREKILSQKFIMEDGRDVTAHNKPLKNRPLRTRGVFATA